MRRPGDAPLSPVRILERKSTGTVKYLYSNPALLDHQKSSLIYTNFIQMPRRSWNSRNSHSSCRPQTHMQRLSVEVDPVHYSDASEVKEVVVCTIRTIGK
ncbi:hypothetical protein ACJQWK_00677 [Exserohilum turcicum]